MKRKGACGSAGTGRQGMREGHPRERLVEGHLGKRGLPGGRRREGMDT